MTASARTLALISISCCAALACGPKAANTFDDAGSGETGPRDEDGIVGSWVGYMEHSRLSSDRVELEIVSVADDGSIVGFAVFGEPKTFAPVTDPDKGYPEGDPHEGGVVEGFTYALRGGYEASVRRLQVEIEVAELWDTWCALQTSYASDNGTHGCLPNCGYSSNAGACTLNDCELAGPVDCGKLSLCRGWSSPSVCHCEEAGCTHDTRWTMALDLHRMDDELTGRTDPVGSMYLFRE